MREAAVFVVHVWRAGGEGECFRASLRRVDQERALLFTRPLPLARFLERQAARADAVAAAGQPADPRRGRSER
jgi:hypothetical protein